MVGMGSVSQSQQVGVDTAATIARVLPNVTGLDKEFDYLVPRWLAPELAIGDLVRVDLHGRRIGGWVVALDPPDALDATGLKPIVSRTGSGPSAELISLADWAAYRWAGRRRHFLVAGSPERAVQRIPGSQRTGRSAEPRSPASTAILAAGGGVLRLPPTSDPKPAVMSAVALGPTLVVVSSADQALLMASALRRSGLSVATVPHDWALAAGGTDVVIGARSAAWAPCPGLAAAVVIDEHDEALQAESSPTWHARDVVIERCRRVGAPVLLTSPCPTLTAAEWGPVTRPPVDRERAGWPIVEVIDRTDADPWQRSMISSRLIEVIRDPSRTVVCVSNATGRARLLACRACNELTRCERCEAAVGLDDADQLVCHRCGALRPVVCLHCGGSRLANLRPGVARLREELEAAAGRPVVLVTGKEAARPDPAGVYVGTEAALHRVERADTVVLLDLDRELLAPRYRASEQAMALLVRAARLVGPRARGGRIMIQTLLPDHPVIQAAVLADPGRILDGERSQRMLLGLPPFGGYAEVSGAGSEAFVESLSPVEGVGVAFDGERFIVRGPAWTAVSAALATGTRPAGSRLRTAVEPAR